MAAPPQSSPQEISHGRLGALHLAQPARGYRFSIDSVLLAAFARPARGPVADLGAGCGVVSVLLAARGLKGPFLAVEIDPLAGQCCRINFAAAGMAGQVLTHDLRQPHAALLPGGHALVVSNPPFGRPGAGRIPPDPARARARHELELSAPELLAVASRLLKAHGRLALCAPPRRLPGLMRDLMAARLSPQRLRLVHGRAGLPAKLALLEAVKDGGEDMRVDPPLMVYAQGQAYTEEVAGIYRELSGASRPAVGPA
jgi:tRNA1Val (adenine37-N6)-methyltransferase